MQNKILPYSQGYFNKNGDLRRLGESINNIDDNFSDAWFETKHYKSGDIVIFKNSMYKAITDNIGTVPTDANTWERIFVSSLINNLTNNITELVKAGTADFTQFKYLIVEFVDSSINNAVFTSVVIPEAIINLSQMLYANDQMYIERFLVNATNGAISVSDANYLRVTDGVIVDALTPEIAMVVGIR